MMNIADTTPAPVLRAVIDPAAGHEPAGEPAPLPRATRRPHVCFVAPLAWPVLARDSKIEVIGGAEVQQSILARALAHAGYRVSMICLDFGQPQRAVVDGVTVYKSHRPEGGVPVLRFIHPRMTLMWQAMRAANADIYYQRCSAMLTSLVAEFCRRYGKRSIYAGASDTDFMPGRQEIRYWRDRWLFERGLARVDRLVVQNATQQKACRANYGREATLIPSCYERPRNTLPGGGTSVLWVATLHEYKRAELFLELARRLPHRQFVLVGGPPFEDSRDSGYFEEIRAAAQALPNVEFTGFLPLARVETYFDQARVLVNTSVYEGMPNTFLQAWSRGVPTVAFVDTGATLGGTPLYKVATSLEQAEAEIERLLADQPYWANASARAREYFERTHSCTGVLARYMQLFDNLMQEPERG
jgi:glycosyltransferase involved in cell wall biosynthesis